MSDLRKAFVKSGLPFRVDIVDWASTSENFRKVIKKEYAVVQKGVEEKPQMPDEWCKMPLKDVAELIMGQSPPSSTYNEIGDGLPFFQGVRDFNYRYPSPRVFCSKPSRVAQPGDILLSVRAPIGRVNIADRECATGRGLAIIRPYTKSDARYLEFILRHLETSWDAIEGSGSVFGNATKKDLETLPLLWPRHKQERDTIAHILGALDDKIELNRRMSKTLDAMAQALFKSWFVDFDPVYAKMEGRWRRGEAVSGLQASLWDLFPDKFVDSEIGKIPEGWEIKSLDQIARFVNGLPLQKHPPIDGKSLPIIKITQLRAGHTKGADLASADLMPEYIVEDGNILFSWSGSLECVLWTGGLGALNQHLFKVIPKNYPVWLCYLAILHHLSDFRQIAAAKATTMGHIQRYHLSNAKLAIPLPDLLVAIDTIIQPIVKGIGLYLVQSRAIEALRDTLLPRLLSGDLRVKYPKRFRKAKSNVKKEAK